MPNARGTAFLLALGAGLLAGAPAEAQNKRLVPAQFRMRVDGTGASWNVDTYGRLTIGRLGSVNELRVAGSTFRSTSRMMTADGSTYVLRGVASRYSVTRRVTVSPSLKGVRQVEVIENTSTGVARVQVTLTSRINMSGAALVSDLGNQLKTKLGAREGGVVAPGRSNVSAVFWLADRNSKLKPTLYKRHNYELRVTYTVQIPPRKSVAIVHGVGQTTVAVAAGKPPSSLFRPFKARAFVRSVPRDVRKLLVNTRSTGGAPSSLEEGVQSLEEELGLRSSTLDQLAFGEETLVRGNASCEKLVIESTYGRSEVRFDNVSAMVGEANQSGETRLLFRDGQKLSGKLSAEGLKFAMTTGLSIDLSIARLDRLVRRADAEQAQLNTTDSLLVETYTGDRLLVKAPKAAEVALATRWGVRRVGVDRLRGLRLIGDGQPGYWVTLTDGSRFRAFLTGDSLELTSTLFGDVRFRPTDVRALIATDTLNRKEGVDAPDSDEPRQPHLSLVGGDLLVGQIDLSAVHFTGTGEVIPVPPSQLRLLKNQLDGDAPELGKGIPFRGEIWGGGEVMGVLRESVLPIQTPDGQLLVPTREVLAIRVPTPRISPGVRRQITKLIRDLGNPSWERREAASRELEGLGALARLPLEEAAQQTKDPEVERRLRLLLDKLGAD